MAKGPSKATLILNEARQRLSVAKQNVETAEGQLGIARAALNAHQMAYDALERALTPKPRKKAAQSQSAQAALPTDKKEKEPDAAGPKCGVCGNPEDFQDHFQPSPHYHPFESSAPVVEKKLRRKSAAANNTQSTETNSEGALAVGAGGD